LSSIRNSTGSLREQAVLSDSQNSPSLVGAVANRDVRDFVRVKPLLPIRDLLDPVVDAAGIGGSDGVQALRARAAALRRDVQRAVPPVRGHLPTAVGRVVLGADGGEKHLARRHTER
jgi:hypothetical protein